MTTNTFPIVPRIVYAFMMVLLIILLYYAHTNRISVLIFSKFICSSRNERFDCQQHDKKLSFYCSWNDLPNTPARTIHIGMVVCGGRANEAVVSFKSTVLFTKISIQAHIFADNGASQSLKSQFSTWPPDVLERFSYKIYPIQYPSDQNSSHWIKLFELCATQRLFIPNLLQNVDSLIYFDTDTLILSPLDELWRRFEDFNSTQIAGMSLEAEQLSVSWYKLNARFPYVAPYGINSGVMLMNMTRMRKINWKDSIVFYFKQYKNDLKLGDQDLINIFFHFNPEKVFIFPCNWNYRPEHCRYDDVTNACWPAVEQGASVLHGSRSSFHDGRRPGLQAAYRAFNPFKFNEPMETSLLPAIVKFIQESKIKICNDPYIFTKQIRRHIQCINSRPFT